MANILTTIETLQKLTNSKISQSDLARALNITRSTISKRIKTNSGFSFEELKKIGIYYGVNLTLGEQNNENSLSEDAFVFSKKIMELRKTLNLSRKELANELGITEQTIFSYETGIIPSFLFFVNLCRKYRVNANWFITDTGAMFNNIEGTNIKDELTLKIESVLKQYKLI